MIIIHKIYVPSIITSSYTNVLVVCHMGHRSTAIIFEFSLEISRVYLDKFNSFVNFRNDHEAY